MLGRQGMNRRVVLRHASGLRQIVGTTDDLKRNLQVEDLPSSLPAIDFGDHLSPCRIETPRRRYVVYREAV